MNSEQWPKAKLDALAGSIKKWDDIAERGGPELGWANCPLCTEFYDYSCQECPIRQAGDFLQCDNTPYKKWVKNTEITSNGRFAKSRTARRIACEERQFLKSLWPAGYGHWEDYLVEDAA